MENGPELNKIEIVNFYENLHELSSNEFEKVKRKQNLEILNINCLNLEVSNIIKKKKINISILFINFKLFITYY